MSEKGSPERAADLLHRAADDRLTEQETAELESLIRQDESVRRRYLELASLGAQLNWLFGDVVEERLVQASPRVDGPRVEAILRRPLVAFAAGMAVAASLLGMAGVLSWPASGVKDPGSGDIEAVAKVDAVAEVDPEASAPDTLAVIRPAESPGIATLTGMVDCRWSKGFFPLSYGAELSPGQEIRLESGYAQVTFESGARCILQGKTDFVVHSEMLAQLNRGKLSTLVMPQAHGFTVTSPTAHVLDLGTEFGMEVDAKGQTELLVFDGEVLSWRLDADGEVEGDAFSLVENEAAAFELDGKPRMVKADSGKYVREISPRISVSNLPPLPVVRDLKLWLAADVLVEKDTQDRIIAWPDILVGDNQMSDDAWPPSFEKAQPRWVAEAIGGKPALRFNGETTYLVTMPFETTPDQTVFVVFSRENQPHDANAKRQILNYNGPPFNLAKSSKPFRILQIDDEGRQGYYQGFVYAGVDEKLRTSVGGVRLNHAPMPGQPAVLGYLYNASEKHAELWRDGQSQGTSTALSGEEFISRKIIGRHPLYYQHFKGDIAEMLIYNAALSQDEIAGVNDYLIKKYLSALDPLPGRLPGR